MIKFKLIILFIFAFPISFLAQEKFRLYIKLKENLSENSKTNVLYSINKIKFNNTSVSYKVITNNILQLNHDNSRETLEAISNEIKKQENVDYTSIISTTPIKPPSDIAPETPNFSTQQTYLGKNPGINSEFAWNNGIFGQSINLKVIEYGLNLNHEDLNDKNISIHNNLTINSEASISFTEHGTATAGVIYSNDGNYGVTGIAHNLNDYKLFLEWTEEYGYDRIKAISDAIDDSKKGDIIVFEMQAYGENNKFVPAEFELLVWDLTKTATEKGIIVIAAAGNGDENLDDEFYTNYLNRGDSGAILVGAGSDDIQHSALQFSTYGSRIDIQGWGKNVYTTGEAGSNTTYIGNDFNQTYSYYSGTSSATSMIAGVAALLQSYYFSLTNNYLTSIEMRNLIKLNGITSESNFRNVGVFPDIEKAMENINSTLKNENIILKNIAIFPNPFDDEIEIKFNQEKNIWLQVYDINGKNIYSKNIKNKSDKINLSFLKKGLYIFKLTSATKQLNKIFLKK